MPENGSEQKKDNVGAESADVVRSGMESHVKKVIHTGRVRKAMFHEGSVAQNGAKGREWSKSHWYQKQNIKKGYATKSGTGSTAGNSGKKLGNKLVRKLKSSFKGLLPLLGIAGFMMVLNSFAPSGSAIFSVGGNAILGTSYTAEDKAIIGVEADYSTKEEELREQIDNVETTNPGYDEYRYELDEINHNPYELISYLTVVFEDFTRADVQDMLTTLFEKQYKLLLLERVEIHTRTETRTGTRMVTDPKTGIAHEETYEYEVEVEYEYYILNVTLENKGLGEMIQSSGLSLDQMERYQLLMGTCGNRSYLFSDDIYAVPGENYLDYQIPAEFLTDTEFANMIREAEKYLGYPYVWGGASPETSFDCSGFVSWVINHSGNGWNVGRKTANGLKNSCDIISVGDVKPGDLIFFQGTYPTKGASHVAIYVGNGMMIHAGNPISYASVETEYWKRHFYCYGRLSSEN